MKNNKLKIKFIKNAMLMVCLFSLSGCGIYRSSFVCPDAKGANCMSMDMVDKMIASGEIEVYNESQNPCKGKLCKKYRELKSNNITAQKQIKIEHKLVGDL